MADNAQSFDPKAKSGELAAARMADAIRRRADRKIEGALQTGREKFQEAGQKAETKLRDSVGLNASSGSPSSQGDYSARFREHAQQSARHGNLKLREVQGRLDTFENENPEFARYARGKIDQAREDGDLKKTAEGIAVEAMQLKEGLEGRKLTGRLSLYTKALKYGWQLAGKLDEQIEKGRNTGWILAVTMAVAKDVFDMLITFASLPPLPTFVIGPTADIVVSLFFFAFFLRFLWGKGTFIFRMILRRVIPGFILGSIPGLNFIPFFTVTILYAWRKANKIQEQLIRARANLTEGIGGVTEGAESLRKTQRQVQRRKTQRQVQRWLY